MLYYSDDLVSLYLGDAREHTEWTGADVLVTDPPYGIDWSGTSYNTGWPQKPIAGDKSTAARDDILRLWGGDRCAVVFGSPLIAPPFGTKQALVWRKPPDAGLLGSIGGFRRDWEAVHLLGPWPAVPAARSGVLTSGGSINGYLTGHPHGKPVGLLEELISRCPPGVIADPFAGSGTTLIAARNLGRRAIGVEIEERYCEIAARRLGQQAFLFEETTP